MNVLTTWAQGIFNRRLWLTLSAVFLVLFVAVGINIVGIRMFDDVEGWRRWLDEHKVHFVAWRLSVYGATIYGWRWMRKRVLLREPEFDNRSRLRRTELAAGLFIIVLEATTWLPAV
jgi:hypothetical protein